MGTREDYMLALGIAPPVALPAGTQGPLGAIASDAAGDASDRVSRIYKALGVAGKSALDANPTVGAVKAAAPGIAGGLGAVQAVTNPLGAVASGVGGAIANPDMAKRAGEVAIGMPRPGDPVGNVTSAGAFGVDKTPLRQMPTDDSYGAAPTLGQQPGARPAGYGMGGSISRGPLDAARAEELRQMGLGAELQREQGVNVAGRTLAESDMRDAAALAKMQDAADQQRIDAEAAQNHQRFLDRQEQLADEMRSKRVDPGRLLRNADDGARFTIMLGSTLGGGNAMLNGQNGNSSLDRLDKLIERDIASQIQDIDNGRASYNARNSLFSQMMAETKDRNVAAQATRALIYDATKEKLLADAARLGIPELRTTAEIAANALDQKIAAAKTAMADADYRAKVAAAQAALSAQKAAEKEAWERGLQIEKMNLEREKLNIERIKAGKEGGKEDAAALGEVTKRLADDDVVKNRALIRSLNNKIRPDGSIVGLDTTATLKRGAAGMIPGANLVPGAVDRIGLSDDERNARQEYEQLALLFRHATTGSGGSEKELEGIRKAFEGAGSAAEKVKVIRMAAAELERREALARSSLTDDQKAELQRRLERDGIADPKPVPKGGPAAMSPEDAANPWRKPMTPAEKRDAIERNLRAGGAK